MIFPKSTSSARTLFRLRNASLRRGAARPQIWRAGARRTYASGGHETKKASSDLPWLLGAVGVTVPTCGYILSSGGSHESSGHEEHGEKEGGEDTSETEEEGDAKDEKSEDQSDDGAQSSEEGKEDSTQDSEASSDSDDSEGKEGNDSGSEDEDSPQDTPETSEDESSSEGGSGSSGSGVKFKGPTKGGPAADERLRIPDAKGGFKRRINSSYGNRQGHIDDLEEPENAHPDRAASSKPVGGTNTQSKKQEGLSNTDTKHSYDLKNSELSKKGEGMPETAKSRGTVDPHRRQPDDE